MKHAGKQYKARTKKGYYFMVDALIAMFVLTLGVVMVLIFNYGAPPQQPIATLSQDFIDVLSKTKLKEIDDSYIGPSGTLLLNGNITNPDNTVLQQLSEFYYRSKNGCTFCLTLINNTVYHAVPVERKYNYIININNEVVFTKNQTSLQQARLVLPARKIVHGELGRDLYGPYAVEVLVWE